MLSELANQMQETIEGVGSLAVNMRPTEFSQPKANPGLHNRKFNTRFGNNLPCKNREGKLLSGSGKNNLSACRK